MSIGILPPRRLGLRLVLVSVLATVALVTVAAGPCTAQPTPPPYRVQVNDVLEFLFFKNTELNQVQTVGPDGEVWLQLIGSVEVVGRTIEDITAEVTKLYAKELVHPQVTVAIKEYGGLKVYVGGEVNQPGIQVYRGGLTALQALVTAGGFKTTARLSSVILIRKGTDGKPIGSIVDMRRVLKRAELQRDVKLAPADILFVPRSRVANVNLFVEEYFRNMWPIPVGIGWTVTK
jgi:polysaccharide export outer membrane protein